MEGLEGQSSPFYQKSSNPRAKEPDLQLLRQAVAVVDEDSEVEEVDEEDEANIQESHVPCAVAMASLETRYEAGKGGAQGACNLEVEACADALCAAFKAVIVNACERERKQSAGDANRVAARVRNAAPL
jgi:hypothetical protein